VISSGHYAELPNGIRLHYARAGSTGAPPILLLHGFPEYWGAWEDLMPLLSDEYQLVAPDLRGFNLSSQPLDVPSYRVREIVGDLELLCEHLGWERPAVVAHGWGGAVAWQWAIARPQRIAKLVMLNSPHPIPIARELASNPAQQAASAYMNWLRAPGSEAGLAKHDFAALEGFFLRMQRDDASWYTPERAARYREVWARGLTGGVNYYRASPLHPPLAGEASVVLDPAQFHVRVPTQVIWGEADTALPARLLAGLEELIDDLTIQRLPRATHWLAHEEPGAIAAAIRAFVGRA
jgi:pimeloyl-ACP methyl ester carboxylesterase